MADNNYSFTGIYLPENKKLTRLLKRLSLATSLIVMGCGLVILLGWITNVPMLKNGFIGNTPVPIMSAFAFILSVAPLLFEKGVGRLGSGDKTTKNSRFFFLTSYLVCSFAVLVIGFLQILNYFNVNQLGFGEIFYNNLSGEKQAAFTIGFNFFLIGIALLYARIKALHRFHVVQFLALNVFVINLITVLGYLFRLVTPFPYSHIIYIPQNIALIFFALSLSLSFRWPARGFIGMFTTDSISSSFALRVLFLKTISITILGLLILVGVKMDIYNLSEGLVIFVLLAMVLALCLTWLNIKLLYKLELERFIMKEELRIHDIDLKLDNESLAVKMKELTEINTEYQDKLKNKEKYEDVIENLD